eukprot:1183358-Pyramimonas_sp.AAC.1
MAKRNPRIRGRNWRIGYRAWEKANLLANVFRGKVHVPDRETHGYSPIRVVDVECGTEAVANLSAEGAKADWTLWDDSATGPDRLLTRVLKRC